MGGSSSKRSTKPTTTTSTSSSSNYSSHTSIYKPPPAPVYKPPPAPVYKPPPAPVYNPPPAPVKYPAPIPTPIIAANNIAHHSVNNYLIDVITDTIVNRPTINPGGKRVDKYSFKVCARYTSRKGCKSDYCYRLHVCSFWIRDSCKKDDCNGNHDFNSPHNRSLITNLLSRRYGEFDLIETLKKSFFSSKTMKGDISTVICMDNILKQCKRNNCEAIHTNSLFSWEICLNENWIPFPRSQNNKIEACYCDPNNDKLVLQPMSPNSNTKKNSVDQVFITETMAIDFENMSLTSENLFCRIRRLSTPSDIAFFKTVATCWLWFCEDDNGNFIYYTNAIVKDFYIIPFSDYIETQFLRKTKEFSFQIFTRNDTYNLNLENMTQTDGNSSTRKIRRRPLMLSRIENNPETFLSLWPSLSSGTPFARSKISPSTNEFRFVRKMIEATVTVKDLYVERIVNNHLWQAYQLNKSQMLKVHNGNSVTLNEQYLFHGTSDSAIDKICAENLDWRLYGTNVGNVYGRGTYFANSAEISLNYASQDSQGYRHMFIVAVLVGTAAVGNSQMKFPPIIPKNTVRFDSTVNDVNPKIFVKYNLDDYYPVYLVKFKTANFNFY